MTYIIKFDKDGNRNETYLKEELLAEKVQALLEQGFVEVSEEDYQLLLGNVDGKIHIRVVEDGKVVYKEELISTPTQEDLDKMEATKTSVELKELAVTAMMMTLAGEEVSESKKAYQVRLNSVSDNVALFMTTLYPSWSIERTYKVGERITYNNVLYKVLQDHTSQENWKPDVSSSLFAKVIRQVGEEIPEWQQPSAENAYMQGDKVCFNNKIYESLIDNNVWSPEANPQGWKEVVK